MIKINRRTILNFSLGMITVLVILIGITNLFFGDGFLGFLLLGFGLMVILGRTLYENADDPHGLVFGRRVQ